MWLQMLFLVPPNNYWGFVFVIDQELNGYISLVIGHMIDEWDGIYPILMYKYVYDSYENLYRLCLPYLMLCNLEYVIFMWNYVQL